MLEPSLAFGRCSAERAELRLGKGVRSDEDRESGSCPGDAFDLEGRLILPAYGGRSRRGLSPAGAGRSTIWRVPKKLVNFPMELDGVTADDGAVAGMRALTDFGGRVRAAREAQGLTQEQVAERSGVHATEVSRIEAGKRDPKVSTLLRLAAALETSPGSLLD